MSTFAWAAKNRNYLSNLTFLPNIWWQMSECKTNICFPILKFPKWSWKMLDLSVRCGTVPVPATCGHILTRDGQNYCRYFVDIILEIIYSNMPVLLTTSLYVVVGTRQVLYIFNVLMLSNDIDLRTLCNSVMSTALLMNILAFWVFTFTTQKRPYRSPVPSSECLPMSRGLEPPGAGRCVCARAARLDSALGRP